ncbi:MAG: hypothetical protein HY796_07055 [Elusimicrobia bacterium]|nr:hypothetical protein [Elusimicrobiota bacterium]
MRYEAGELLRRVLKKILSGYGVPAALSVVFISIIVYAVSFRNSNPASGFFPRAQAEFLEARGLERKLSGLKERLRNNSNDIQALFESGLLKFQKGPAGYIAAISDLETARTKGLSDIRTFYYLGRMYQAVGLYDFALQEYERFLNNRPDDFEVRMLMAKLLFAAGKYPQAVREYDNLNGRYPENVLVLENLALSRFKNAQDWRPVLDALRKLGLEAAFRADYVQAQIAYENKDYASAVPLLNRTALNLKSPELIDRVELYRMLSDSCIKLKSDAGAMVALNELLKINPANDEARSLLARLTRAQSKEARKAQKSRSTKAQSGKGAK